MTLTRDELYDRVWSQPLRTVASTLGLSDVALAKRCRKLNIPVPGRGYWRKIETGKRVRRTPLPTVSPTSNINRYPAVFDARPAPPPPPTPDVVEEQVAYEARPEHRIVVAEQLRSPHPLVRKTGEILGKAKVLPHDYLNVWREQYLDIQVTKPHLHRALRVMDALVKACEARGWTVSLGVSDDKKSYVTIIGRRVPFGIREKLRKRSAEESRAERDRVYPPGTVLSHSTHQGVPAGRLALVIRNSWGHSVQQSWDESDDAPIETQLNAFVIGLVVVAAEEHARHLRLQEEERARAEVARRQEAERQQQAAEAARRKALEQHADNWMKARQIRAFIEAIRTAEAVPPGVIPESMARDEWLVWAEQHAQSLDPLHEARREPTPA